MPVYIRPAGPADAKAIVAVQGESWRATYAALLPSDTLDRVDQLWDAQHWIRTLERVDQRLYTLVLDSHRARIVGFGVAGLKRPQPNSPFAPYDGQIYQIYLRPSFQGKGLGAALMGAMARVLIANGIEFGSGLGLGRQSQSRRLLQPSRRRPDHPGPQTLPRPQPR